jgi:hypothetical protein
LILLCIGPVEFDRAPFLALSLVGDLHRIDLFAFGRVSAKKSLPLFRRNPSGQPASDRSGRAGIECSPQCHRDFTRRRGAGNSVHLNLTKCQGLARVASTPGTLRSCGNDFRRTNERDTIFGDLIFRRFRLIFLARGLGLGFFRAGCRQETGDEDESDATRVHANSVKRKCRRGNFTAPALSFVVMTIRSEPESSQ